MSSEDWRTVLPESTSTEPSSGSPSLLFGPCWWEESAWRGREEPLEDGGVTLTIEEWSANEGGWVEAEPGSFVLSKLALAPGIPLDVAESIGMPSTSEPTMVNESASGLPCWPWAGGLLWTNRKSKKGEKRANSPIYSQGKFRAWGDAPGREIFRPKDREPP